MSKSLDLMPVQCKTCPFRDAGWTYIRPLLEERALTQATPICHSTGKALTKRLSRKSMYCRGARNFQQMILHRMGFLEAATDEAWEKKAKEMRL